jgi:nucleoside-diphosphate-sugar epimerase
MAEHKQAVVVGALGVIGRYIVAQLLAQGDWSVVGLSRRTADAAPRYRHIAVDLLDGQCVAEKLAGLKDVTHVFLRSVSACGRRRCGLCIEHSSEPRHARQRRHGDR